MSELLDLVDTNGKIVRTGVVRKESMKLDGLHVQTAIVVTLNSTGQAIIHRRSKDKRLNPGFIDHVCGAIQSGELPEIAGKREAQEEIGIKLDSLKLIRQGVNEYNNYTYLFVGYSDEKPKIESPDEVQWVGIKSPEELKELKMNRKEKFVDGFFEDLELALSTKKD